MSYPSDLVKVQLTFNLEGDGGPLEEAVTGFWMHRNHQAANSTDWPNDVQQAAEKVRDKWISHMDHSLFPTTVTGRVVKVFHVDAAGETIDEGIAPFVAESYRGSASGVCLPWENSLCVSTYSYDVGAFVSRPARRRGRMYLPPMTTGVIGGAEGKVSTGYMGTLVPALNAFFDDVQHMAIGGTPDELDDFWDLAIVSNVGSMWNRLSRFDVGNVMDVQRRRRRKEVEQRTAGAGWASGS